MFVYIGQRAGPPRSAAATAAGLPKAIAWAAGPREARREAK